MTVDAWASSLGSSWKRTMPMRRSPLRRERSLGRCRRHTDGTWDRSSASFHPSRSGSTMCARRSRSGSRPRRSSRSGAAISGRFSRTPISSMRTICVLPILRLHLRRLWGRPSPARARRRTHRLQALAAIEACAQGLSRQARMTEPFVPRRDLRLRALRMRPASARAAGPGPQKRAAWPARGAACGRGVTPVLGRPSEGRGCGTEWVLSPMNASIVPHLLARRLLQQVPRRSWDERS